MSLSPENRAGMPEKEMSESPVSLKLKADGKKPTSLGKKPREAKAGIIISRPGQEAGVWEEWLLMPESEPELLSSEAPLSTRCDRVLILPSISLFAWPLWIAAEGESLDLVSLELSGRHLLKRGMEESLAIIPILRREDRQLLLAVATDEPFPAESLPPGWNRAARFELPARLLPGSRNNNDLILWEEWGVLQMAFYRESKPVWFCSVRLHELSGLIHRMALRLLSEGILEHLPGKILVEGVREHLAGQCRDALSKAFPQAQIVHLSPSPEGTVAAPILRDDSFDLPPGEAQAERRNLKKRQRIISFATVGVLLYLLLLIWGAGYLFIRQTALKRLQNEIAQMQAPSLNAQDESDRWHEFRPVIDPTTYALDLLSAVAAPTDGGKIRLTLYSLEQGSLHISGEATDVTQAYSFIEQLKKNPLLQEYNWTSGVPQIAGKNSVKFDLQGTRTDATHETTGS